ncbi:DNA-3-methyladenine glycosylase I [Ancylobacter novellus DSM 506]|uniref:DNA-3-methyladenine glycosylase I n=1 Tax=Ancylobacter novellus (strain ATCC 8093 / DSM 506 / JCM 20403 / CCM 1077 / IAM 12100 / NBRC 12443 / NCIMB 10456) TaxID=639283 RepID=D6ZZL8_ANCN5|nr:DNA-3-methyladenine glycosylase I [Ancylobacter novellus]ADH91213.1 DNA-3-methyladenine glycosylase I [Ancylobacter novellus DSM 506]
MNVHHHPDGVTRCAWCGTDPLYVAYHDTEWGVPEYDDRALFEKLILDGFQAGLAWITILRKRDGFRAAFDGFEPEIIARYSPEKVEALMQDAGIIRNRSKIVSTVRSAQSYLDIMERGPGFSKLLWDINGPVLDNRRREGDPPIVTSPVAQAMSKELKSRGFNFVGPTIVYAFMQAVGMVNDHAVTCHRHGVAI